MGAQAGGPGNGDWRLRRIERDIEELQRDARRADERYVTKDDLTAALEPIRATQNEMKQRQQSLSSQLLGALLLFAVSLLVGIALFIIERAGG